MLDEETLLADDLVPGRTHPIVAVAVGPGATDRFIGQADLGVLPWAGAQDTTDLDGWVDALADHLAGFGQRVHVLATGPAAYPAIVLAARRAELVMSLLLGDPEVDPDAEGYAALLREVAAPTLVIAAAPDPDAATPQVGAAVSPEIAQAQSIAGGIDNGVFVVIDGCPVPAHRERGSSFNEWVTSFTIIAEGLVALTQQRQEERHG